MNLSQVVGKRDSLTQNRERLEREQQEALNKAINSVETAVKEKHIRSTIIGSWQEKGCSIFWANLGRMPLTSQTIMCWKSMMVLHKLLREGHPNALTDSFRYIRLLKDMHEFWKHSPAGSYGKLIFYYMKVLINKLEFHQKNPTIPGSLKDNQDDDSPNAPPIKLTTTDINDIFQLAVEVLDYQDHLLELQNAIFSSLNPSRRSSQMVAVQCRICPFPVMIQDCTGLYQILVFLMKRLYTNLPDDVLTGHLERFNKQFYSLKKFFFDAGNLAYVTSLISVPRMPSEPPQFTSMQRSLSEDNSASKRLSVVEVVQATPVEEPPVMQEEMLQLSQEIPQVDERDQLIEQLRMENTQLRQMIALQRREMKTMEDQLRTKIAKLDEELNNSKTTVEEMQNENAMLKSQLEVKEDESKKGQPLEERFTKIKNMYTKLREEHITLLRSNGEVKKKLASAERTQQEAERKLANATEELEEKEEKLQEAVKASDAAEKAKKVADAAVDQLKEEMARKDSELNERLSNVTQTAEDSEKAMKELQQQHDLLQKELEEKVVQLTSQIETVTLEKASEEENMRTTQVALESLQTQSDQKVQELNNELTTLKTEHETLENQRKVVEDELCSVKLAMEEKVQELNTRFEEAQKAKEEEEEELKKTNAQAIEELRQLSAQQLEEQDSQRNAKELSDKQALLDHAVDHASNILQDTLSQVKDPKYTGTTCTAEYLQSRVETVPGVLEDLKSSFSTYKDNKTDISQLVCTLSVFSHQLSDSMLHAASTSNMAPQEEAQALSSSAEGSGTKAVELLTLMKDPNTDMDTFSAKAEEVRKELDIINNTAKALAPKESDSLDSLENAVDEEINSTAELVADAASRIEAMLNKTRSEYSGVQLEVNERILDSCTSLMQAIKILIIKSKELQQEIVSEGMGSATAREFYKRHHRWTEGLISAAKAVGWGAKVLVDSADDVLQGKGKFEELVVASNEISASTAQLVAASKVKAKPGSTHLTALQVAAKGVAESTAGVVASVKTGSEMIEDSKTVPDYSKLTLTQAKRLEMDSQVKVLELENLLTKERDRLGQLRRAHYQLAGASEGWEEETQDNS